MKKLQTTNSPHATTVASLQAASLHNNSSDDVDLAMRVQKLSGQWKQHMGSAKVAWGKLTQDQLLQTEGHYQKLVGLVEEKYAITKIAADKQVRAFIEKHIR